MNEMTLYLSQLMGPVMLVIGVSFLLKHKAYHKLFKKMYKDGAFLFITAIVELTAGLAIVLSHNLWSTLPEVLISLMGCAMVLEGTLVMLNDKVNIKKMMHMMNASTVVMLSGLVVGLVGAYLSYLGYLA